MALRELPLRIRASALRCSASAISTTSRPRRRHASTESTTFDPLEELEASSLTTPGPSEDIIKSFDPIQQSKSRPNQLPPSRYQYRPPKYYRGPLHPHQPPPPSDPSSREFVPGPFTLPRLEQTYQTTIAPDLMILSYSHLPPGWKPPVRGPRLREWDGSSPYHKNRPPRGPRGGSALRLLKRPITFRNIPRLERVTVHAMVSGAMADSGHLHAAGMALQAITSVRATACQAKQDVSPWGLRKGKYVAVKCDLRGEDMWHFVSRCVDVVLPRIKDWPGVKGSAGDSSGNITFGLGPEAVRLFPEIEVNYDMYPPNMMPGCHITLHTTATDDRQARLLLGAIGIPFYGKLVN